MGMAIPPDPEKLFQLVEQAQRSLDQTKAELSERDSPYEFFSSNDWAEQHVQITLALEQAIRNLEKDRTLSPELQGRLKEAKQLVADCRSKFYQIAKKIGQVAYQQLLYPQEKRIDPYALLQGDQEVLSYLYEWHINVGLILTLYRETSDPNLKKTLFFLALNYLAKAAPITFKGATTEENEKLSTFQLGAMISHTYHRETGGEYEKFLVDYTREKFANSLKWHSPRVLIDTPEITELFPLVFTVLELSEGNHLTMEEQLTQHFKQYGKEEGFQHFFKKPFLFDLTHIVGNSVFDSSGTEGEAALKAITENVRQTVDLSIEKTVQEMKAKYPDISEDDAIKIGALLKANCCFVFRTEIDEFGVLSNLPIFCDFSLPDSTIKFLGVTKRIDWSPTIEGRSYERNRSEAMDSFPAGTGIKIGAITLRKQLFHAISLENFIDAAGANYEYSRTAYAVQGNQEAMIFESKDSFIQTNLFVSFVKEMHRLAPDVPYAGIMGLATSSLIQGLFEEISPETWEKIHQDPVLKTLMQTTLMRMRNHLATAMDQRNDFSKFMQAIELVHAELATILEITRPFDGKAFETIYQENLKKHGLVPPSTTVRCGVAKSAMNVVAGVNIAVLHQCGYLSRASADHAYFETLKLLGPQSQMSQQKTSAEPKEINLYMGEFNHNIQLGASFTHYEKVNVISDIEYLLEHKKTEHLTVALDCTIDSFDSPNVKKVLQRFSSEIKEGKINFVLYRSGQKFDMLGMDNYYGAPFYIINNGEPYWEEFHAMIEKSAYQTDPLSMQWFSLASKYTSEEIDRYRKQVFANSREILDHVPEELRPDWPGEQRVRVNSIAPDVDSSFIDIKVPEGSDADKVITAFYQMAIERGVKIHARGSFGFYHANLNYLPGSLRINPGINPEENQFIIEFLQEIPRILEKQ